MRREKRQDLKLEFEIFSQTNGMSFDNDAKSCYDRIVMNLALLASQKLGMPAVICQWYQKFLNHASYHIQLPKMTSETNYSHTPDNPLHGPGQGSRAAPSLWVIVSSLIMKCMEDKAPGMTFQDPTGTHTSHHIMTGFVDDTTHWVNDFQAALKGNYSKQDLYDDTYVTAQWWEQLLSATGGKLELPKCFYYTITWQFTEEGVPFLPTTKDENYDIQILSSDANIPVSIEEKTPHESHKTLGVMENPSGKYDDEYRYLQQKSQTWRESINNQHLTRQEIQLFYQSFYLPSIRYHLTINTFTRDQLEKIQHPVVQTILQRMGYNSNMPKDVIYGDTTAGGLGYTHLFAMQGQQKLKLIFQAYRSLTPHTTITHITLQWAQHLSGLTYSIFEHPEIPIPQLSDNNTTQISHSSQSTTSHSQDHSLEHPTQQ